jgi:CxxC motif-containing protein (DUF1111 family)
MARRASSATRRAEPAALGRPRRTSSSAGSRPSPLLGREPDPALPEVKLAKDRESSEPVEYSERNATALFGVGLIDSIPQEVLLEVERKSFEYFPRTLRSTDKGLEGEYGGGRINRLSNGVLGRFGWKGQGASLREFTSAACAVELGLQHAFHTQPLPEYDECESPANDLSEEDFQGLVAFVAALPAPRQELPESPRQRAIVELGKQRFAEVGCAECHLPNVGKVEGIYSDLLLHRMVAELSGWGTDAVYGGFDRRRHSAM